MVNLAIKRMQLADCSGMLYIEIVPSFMGTGFITTERRVFNNDQWCTKLKAPTKETPCHVS